MVETLDSLAGRPGWTAEGAVAVYCPTPGGWTARVRASPESKFYARWHVAVIDPHGIARYVTHASLLGQAAREAERRVLAQPID